MSNFFSNNGKSFNKNSYWNFLYMNYFFYKKYERNIEDSEELFTKSAYNRVFQYFHTKRYLFEDYLSRIDTLSREVEQYCFRYGLFSDYEVGMVKELVEKRIDMNTVDKNLTIDEILTKYQQVDLKIKLKDEYSYNNLIKTYAHNDKRLNQILSFVDPYLLDVCFDIIHVVDFPRENYPELKGWLTSNEVIQKGKEELLEIAPKELSNEIQCLIDRREFDKLVELLHNQQSNKLKDFTYPNVNLTWEETVKDIIKYLIKYEEHPVEFFSDILKAYFALPRQFNYIGDVNYGRDLDCYEATFPILKLYLKNKRKK